MATLPGWDTFFEEIAAFLTSLQQQTGNASESFCHYAIERLEDGVYCELIKAADSIKSPRPPAGVQQEDAAIIVEYCSPLSQLLQCLRVISLEWQTYLEVLELRTLQSAYAPG